MSLGHIFILLYEARIRQNHMRKVVKKKLFLSTLFRDVEITSAHPSFTYHNDINIFRPHLRQRFDSGIFRTFGTQSTVHPSVPLVTATSYRHHVFRSHFRRTTVHDRRSYRVKTFSFSNQTDLIARPNERTVQQRSDSDVSDYY